MGVSLRGMFWSFLNVSHGIKLLMAPVSIFAFMMIWEVLFPTLKWAYASVASAGIVDSLFSALDIAWK